MGCQYNCRKSRLPGILCEVSLLATWTKRLSPVKRELIAHLRRSLLDDTRAAYVYSCFIMERSPSSGSHATLESKHLHRASDSTRAASRPHAPAQARYQ